MRKVLWPFQPGTVERKGLFGRPGQWRPKHWWVWPLVPLWIVLVYAIYLLYYPLLFLYMALMCLVLAPVFLASLVQALNHWCVAKQIGRAHV